MKELGKPMYDLRDKEALKRSRTARASVRFLSLNPPIDGVPMVEFRGQVIDTPEAEELIEMVSR